jgi:hypothetical protein
MEFDSASESGDEGGNEDEGFAAFLSKAQDGGSGDDREREEEAAASFEEGQEVWYDDGEEDSEWQVHCISTPFSSPLYS